MWIVRRVTQGFAQAADGIVQAVFEFDERILGPEPLLKLISGDHFAGMLEESEQELERLLVELNADALLAQLSRLRIHLERAEANRGLWRRTGHIVLFSHCGEQRHFSITPIMRTEDSLKLVNVST